MPCMILAFFVARSVLVIPGCLGCPAVMITSSLFSIWLKSEVPMIFPSNSIAGAVCIMSSASPLARFSAMSRRMTSSLILRCNML